MFRTLFAALRRRAYDALPPGPWRTLIYRPNPKPVIVIGNQKSGTSAIAHLLADHAGLAKSIDVPAVWPPTFTRIARRYETLLDVVRAHPLPFSNDLIKEPYLTFLYSPLRSAFPKARYLFVLRDPRDNIRSILDRLGIPGDRDSLSYDEYDLPPAWKPTFVPEIWSTDRHQYVEILAERWNSAVDTYLTHKKEMQCIRYEDFLADKAGVISRLARRLELEGVHDISDRVDVAFQPRGSNRDVPWNEFFGEKNLRGIEAICHDRMEHFGYEVSCVGIDDPGP